MQIGTPFSGMPRSSSAGMQRNIRSFTTSAVCVPWADRRAFLIWFPIYALWTRCPSTGWVGGSTVPKHWLPAETVVTFISAKRVPVGTKNGRENRNREMEDGSNAAGRGYAPVFLVLGFLLAGHRERREKHRSEERRV